MLNIVHTPVLLNEVLNNSSLSIENKSMMIDLNLGEGGHTEAFLKKYNNLSVIGVDRDKTIIEKAKERLSIFKDRFTAINAWSDEFLKNYKGDSPDLILFDLGLSMFHYKEAQKGFSFKEETLDMRFDDEQILDAKKIVNTFKEKELEDIFFKYGDEKKARQIAKKIIEYRKNKKIESAVELHNIINSCFKSNVKKHSDNATRVFQALRIFVNDEINRFQNALSLSFDILKDNGRIEVITFHSIEDRVCKYYFRNLFKENKASIITKKPIIPSLDEIKNNVSSRSSKLRIIEKSLKEEKTLWTLNNYATTSL